jgi:NitT/TauT family transport system permease protein
VSAARLRGGLSEAAGVVTALVLLVVVWQVMSGLVGQGFLPTPGEVGSTLRELVTESSTWSEVAVTGRRVLESTVIATALGVVVGFWIGLQRKARAAFLPYLLIALAIPGPIYIMMAILIFGIGETTTMGALIVSVTPFVANVARLGVAARDRNLDQMAEVYYFDRRTWIRHVLIPQMTPTLWASLRTGYAFSWKLVVLMEFLSTNNGIGAAVNQSFRRLDYDAVVVYLLLFIAVMYLVDVILLGRIEARSLRWRARPATNPV